MKKALFALFLVLAMFSYTFAASHNHDAHKKSNEGSMGKLVFKGAKKGVSVKAELNDIESAMKAMMKDSSMKIDMSKMDPNITHHLTVTITSSKEAGEVKSATLKTTYKNQSQTYTLMSMHGHFGSDISLKEAGSYKAVLTIETDKAGRLDFEFTLKK